jgi:hypothetical protein
MSAAPLTTVLGRAKMLWVLVVALVGISVAAATALVGWHQVTLLRAALTQCDTNFQRGDAEMQSLRDKRAETDLQVKRLAMTVTELLLSREATDKAPSGPAEGAEPSLVPAAADDKAAERNRQAAAAVAGLQRWADGHLMAADTDATTSAQLVENLRQYVVASLEHEASRDHGARILRLSLFAEQPAVRDIGPKLMEGLWTELGAKPMYRQPEEPSGIRFYVRWAKDGHSPEDRLRSLLASARNSGASPGDQEARRLQVLLAAVYDGGPCVLQFGPLLVARTPDSMGAAFVSASWPGLRAVQLAAARSGTAVDLLTGLGATDPTDLTEWAGQQAA